MRLHIRLSLSLQHFLLYVDVFAHRRASVKENVSEASRVIQFLLVSLSDLLLTGLERMESSQMEQRRRMVRRLP